MKLDGKSYSSYSRLPVLIIALMLGGCFEDEITKNPLPPQHPPQVATPAILTPQPLPLEQTPVVEHWTEIGQQALDGKRCSTWWTISNVTPEGYWSAVKTYVSGKWPNGNFQKHGSDTATYQIPIGRTPFGEDRTAQVQIVMSAAANGTYRVDWHVDVQIDDKMEVDASLKPEAEQLYANTSGASATTRPADDSQFLKLTKEATAHLASIKSISGAVLSKWSPLLNGASKWSKTYDAVDAIMKTAPSSEPGSPLVKMSALIDLVHIWRPDSALDYLNVANEDQYSSLLKSLASSLNDISSNINKRNIRGGVLVNGVDALKVFIATLMDARAIDAASVPDAVITQEVINWYVEHAEPLSSLIGGGPQIQKKTLFGRDDWREDIVDRGALKVWCYANRHALKYYLYERALVPEELSYFSTH